LTYSSGEGEEYHLNRWTKKRADWMFNGHLKLSGSVSLQGIVEPICEGDNVQINDIVYHIESVSHNCSINSNGIKTFTTALQLSNGLYSKGLESDKKPPVYFSSALGPNSKNKILSHISYETSKTKKDGK